MRSLIKLEYKKMWNRVSLISISCLFVLSALFAAITLNLQYRTLDKNGELVTGLSAFRALKEAAKDIEGEIDDAYLQELIADYNASFDKAYLEENRGFMGTGGMTKYQIPNYLINYAYYSAYMSNGNEKMGLDYEFLDSADHFYEQYKSAVLEQLLLVNEWNGLKLYSEEQIRVLEQKVDNLRIPFRVEYITGLANINGYLEMEYPVFFVLLAFCLASVFAKDSSNGIDELSLSSKYGRSYDMKARWISGNLFALTAYFIFIAILIVIHGAIGSLHGLSASIQGMWFECLYNINIGTGLLIVILGGMLGSLVFANIVMLLSMMLKKSKIVSVVGLLLIGILVKQAATYSQIKLFNPIRFKGSELLVDYFFVGNIAVPYFVIVLVLSILYIAVCGFLMKHSYTRYRLN